MYKLIPHQRELSGLECPSRIMKEREDFIHTQTMAELTCSLLKYAMRTRDDSNTIYLPSYKIQCATLTIFPFVLSHPKLSCLTTEEINRCLLIGAENDRKIGNVEKVCRDLRPTHRFFSNFTDFFF